VLKLWTSLAIQMVDPTRLGSKWFIWLLEYILIQVFAYYLGSYKLKKIINHSISYFDSHIEANDDPVVYELKSVIEHSGDRAQTGHFTTFRKHRRQERSVKIYDCIIQTFNKNRLSLYFSMNLFWEMFTSGGIWHLMLWCIHHQNLLQWDQTRTSSATKESAPRISEELQEYS